MLILKTISDDVLIEKYNEYKKELYYVTEYKIGDALLQNSNHSEYGQMDNLIDQNKLFILVEDMKTELTERGLI